MTDFSINTTAPVLTVETSGATGATGEKGPDGVGFEDVQYSAIQNPLCHFFAQDKLAKISSPTNTDADINFTRASNAMYLDSFGRYKSAAINEPRKQKGWLIEPTSANLITNSCDLTASSWVKIGATTVTTSFISIIENISASLINFNGTVANKVAADAIISDSENDYYTASVIVKSVDVSELSIRISFFGGTEKIRSIVFDFNSGEVIQGQSEVEFYSVEKLSNAYFRVSLTVTSNGTNSICQLLLYNNDGSKILVNHAQIEKYHDATSPIFTSVSAVTRAADICNIDAINHLNYDNYSLSVNLIKTSNVISTAESNRTIFKITNATSQVDSLQAFFASVPDLIIRPRNINNQETRIDNYGNGIFAINFDSTSFSLHTKQLVSDKGSPVPAVFDGASKIGFGSANASDSKWVLEILDFKVYARSLNETTLKMITKE